MVKGLIGKNFTIALLMVKNTVSIFILIKIAVFPTTLEKAKQNHIKLLGEYGMN